MAKYIKEVRKCLKINILNNTELFGHKKERQQIYDLIERTVHDGESNSALLIGPRGSGKTTLINSVLKDIQELEDFQNNAILVRLHGLIHTDDRLALKSATTQMNLDNAVDGKVFGSFAENLSFLLACLKTGEKRTSKSVIFMLEEFDLFCNHHNQTLLYNLFDISQSAQAPICVLGITSRLDVIELLEKRVKSRFSHRQIFLFAGADNDNSSDVSNLDYYIQRIEKYLLIPKNANISNKDKKQWNSSVTSLLMEKKFQNVIQRLIDIDLNIHTLKLFLLKITTKLSADRNLFTADMFQNELNSFEKDDVIQTLQDLNVLELCLIIAMKHHNDIYDNQPMNFEMILTRYIKFVNKNSGGIQTVHRPVIMKAFEHIENLELISMIGPNSKIQKEYQFFKLLVIPQQLLETINKSSGLPTEVIQWANSSLI